MAEQCETMAYEMAELFLIADDFAHADEQELNWLLSDAPEAVAKRTQLANLAAKIEPNLKSEYGKNVVKEAVRKLAVEPSEGLRNPFADFTGAAEDIQRVILAEGTIAICDCVKKAN